jgi:hypothetical protein
LIQQQAAPQILTPGDPVIRVGKVLAVQRHAHTIDVIFLNGLVIRNVPVVTGWGGSSFGFAGLMAPTHDTEALSRKTYPESPNPVETVRPAMNTEVSRDIYAVLASLEGSARGDSGHVAIGFLYPQVSEMAFPAGHRTPAEEEDLADTLPALAHFRDFLLFRHPSDLEAMIDGWGGFRLQHPARAFLALMNLPPWSDEEPPPRRADLYKVDYDKLYAIRANTGRQIPVHGLEPHIEARIPKWFIIPWEIEEIGEGLVTRYPPEGPTQLSGPAADTDASLPTPGAFGCDLAVELSTDEAVSQGMRITMVLAEYRGEKARVLRADGRLCEVSPPFTTAPEVGESVRFTKIPIEFCGEVYTEFRNNGHMREEAFWLEPTEEGETIIRGMMFRRTGELHDTVVEAGDIFETAHPSEEAGGNITNRADINHLTTAGEINRMENDAGVVLTMNLDGTANFSAPGDIWITAGGVLHLDGALILENMGGAQAGDEVEDNGDGEDFGGLFPFDIPFIGGGGGNTGIKIPGVGGGGGGPKIPGLGGFKIPGLGGGKGKGGGLFPFLDFF